MARFQSEAVGAYPEYAQASSGGPTFPVFSAVNITSGTTNPAAPLQLGDQIVDKFGNIYLSVRALQALAIGQVVRYSKPGDATNAHPAAGTISASTTTRRIFTNLLTVADESTLGSFLGSPAKADGTGTPFIKRIKDQVAIGPDTTFDVSKLQIFHGIGKYDGDELSGTPQTNDPVAIIKPYTVVVNGTSTAYGEECPVGIALGTVSAGAQTIIQSQGICQVLAGGSGGSFFAVVSGSTVFPAASGVVTGPNGTETAELAFQQLPAAVGTALMASAATTAGLLPVYVRLAQNA